jgi:pyruvate formate lyase activating enzyme
VAKPSSSEENRGLIFNIQKFSLHDGPGIRTTVFLKGCPLSCKWCSNPESIKSYPEIMDYSIKCVGCGKCQEACPLGAIIVDDTVRRIDRTKCTLCASMECVKACSAGGKEQVGRYISVEEAVKEIEKDVPFYKNSGGGVTFSGGEPLLQWKFVQQALKQCREKGIHTVLDTCGHAPWSAFEEVLDYVDLVLYDIKHMDAGIHKEGTGVTNELILANAAKVANRVRTWLRVPVIPDYNDSKSTIERLAKLGAELKVEKISLLPYHGWGHQKYERLGLDYPLEGTTPPTEEMIQEFKGIIESYGLTVSIGR